MQVPAIVLFSDSIPLSPILSDTLPYYICDTLMLLLCASALVHLCSNADEFGLLLKITLLDLLADTTDPLNSPELNALYVDWMARINREAGGRGGGGCVGARLSD